MTFVGKILFLEDDPQDVEMMVSELHNAGFTVSYKYACSRKDFLQELMDFKPDVVISDYSLPMFNGMHAFRLFKEKKMSVPFLLVTGVLTEQLAMECLAEGVDDFLLKSSFKRLPQVILRTLRIKKTELEQERMTAELERKNEELKQLRERSEQARVHELLSEREYQVLCMIAGGHSVKEIADRLFISPATVATYRSRLLEKLDIKSNVDLTRFALHNRLIE